MVAPSTPIERDVAEKVTAIAARDFPSVELAFHSQCFLTHNHFAGEDRVRADALVEVANDPAVDAVWFARGGYGSCRIAEGAIDRMGPAARHKAWLGYSDAGYLLAGLYARGFPDLAHGPMPNDLIRDGGEAAVGRALSWLVSRDVAALEPSLETGNKAAAFNLMVLSQLLGTPLEPDLDGHVLMLEEVSEHMYAIDRSLFHVTAHPALRRLAGIALGRCSLIPTNDRDFGADEEELARFWCARAGIPYLGRADIGHDSQNRVVPFGILGSEASKRR